MKVSNTKKFFLIIIVPILFLLSTSCTKKSLLSDNCPLASPYCGGSFPLNTQNTTPYGPPWANVTTQFYPCYGPYALCYYADCVPGTDSTVTECECDALFGLNFVEVSSILNKNVYEETINVCNKDPDRCSRPNGAPVCDAINNKTFYHTVVDVAAVSDFSFFGFTASAALGTNCTNNPGIYSGCMTTACYTNDSGNYTCICPTFNGPFQVGQKDVSCNILPLTYSAAYNPNETVPKTPTPPSDINCFPDAGANKDNPIACPLYTSSTTLPPNSNVNCTEVCNKYDTCTNSSEIQIGYTCDATICTTEKKTIFVPACLGLQQCNISEIMKAEFAAGCSCCASQLCNCTANNATEKRIWQLNAKQKTNGDTTQCEQNGTLCGKP